LCSTSSARCQRKSAATSGSAASKRIATCRSIHRAIAKVPRHHGQQHAERRPVVLVVEAVSRCQSFEYAARRALGEPPDPAVDVGVVDECVRRSVEGDADADGDEDLEAVEVEARPQPEHHDRGEQHGEPVVELEP
jgi:hypothetical protein